jgi:hypothetical protein
MNDKIDSVLTGMIILLVLIVVWKWHQGSSYGTGLKLSCRCSGGKCRCSGSTWGPAPRRPGGKACSRPVRSREGMQDKREPFSSLAEREKIAASSGSTKVANDILSGGSYSDEAVKNMGLEADVGASHKRYCDSLSFSGMPTGASSCSELEETGRSINTSNFVGLTARKFCRARALATPGPTARTTSSKDIIENCGIDENDLI